MTILGVFGVKTFIIMSQYGANTSMMVLLKRAGGPKGPQPSEGARRRGVEHPELLISLKVTKHFIAVSTYYTLVYLIFPLSF